MTDAFLLLACAACSFGNLVFLRMALFVGTVPIAYAWLRPYSRMIPVWGFPLLDRARLGSLIH